MLKPLLTAAFIALIPGVALAGTIVDVSKARDLGEYERAVKLMRPLAEQGNALAQAILGASYYAGEGVAKDHRQAEKWFRLAAGQGHALSQTFLDLIARTRQPASRDKAAPRTSYTVAAVNPHAGFRQLPQPVRETGPVEIHNESAALNRLRKAAEAGHARAQNSLGALLAHGKGIARDRVEAYKWFYLAARQGLALARRNQTRTASLMTPAEVATAENLAEDWIARTLAASADQPDNPDAG